MTKLAETIRIQENCVFKHPNADQLEVVDVFNNGVDFAITKPGQFTPGDMAIFISSVGDALAPVTDPRFSFLAKDANKDGFVRIKNRKLRGVISRGLLISAEPDMINVEEDVSERLGLKKWYPETVSRSGAGLGSSEECSGPDHLLPTTKYDIDTLGKRSSCFSPGERVILTEKIHGSNCCFTLHEGKLFVRSRSLWKKSAKQKSEERPERENVKEDGFWKAMHNCDIQNKMDRKDPIIITHANSPPQEFNTGDFIYWGEVYGTVQDLTYGLSSYYFVLFDVFNKKNKSWLTWDELVMVSEQLGIERVPVIYDGEWKVEEANRTTRASSEMFSLAEGPTILGAKNGATHTREGFVIRPAENRNDFRCNGRVILKWVGNGYLCR
jgi:RNA ligase (TIGR02306 family)